MQTLNDLKAFLIYLLKSPAFWVAAISLFDANQKWLFPQVPDYAVAAFNQFITVASGLIVAYLAGGYVKEQNYKRALAKSLAAQAARDVQAQNLQALAQLAQKIAYPAVIDQK